MLQQSIQLHVLQTIVAQKPSVSVALVGNARSLFGKHQGNEIDAHDHVIRLNYGKVVSPVDQGTKTTVVGCSDNKLSLSFIQETFAPKAVIWLTNKAAPEHFFDCLDLPLYINQQKHWKEVAKYVAPFRPSSGALAAYFLREIMNFKNISLYGFDFFSTPTFYHRHKFRLWPKSKSHPHSGQREQSLMQQLDVHIY